MCYNCGCQLPHDPMGKQPFRQGGPSLVEEDLREIGKKLGLSLDDVKANLCQELNCACNHPMKTPSKKAEQPILSAHDFHHLAEGWDMTVEETKKNICELLCQTMK